jgi:hypothetical protein
LAERQDDTLFALGVVLERWFRPERHSILIDLDVAILFDSADYVVVFGVQEDGAFHELAVGTNNIVIGAGRVAHLAAKPVDFLETAFNVEPSVAGFLLKLLLDFGSFIVTANLQLRVSFTSPTPYGTEAKKEPAVITQLFFQQFEERIKVRIVVPVEVYPESNLEGLLTLMQ